MKQLIMVCLLLTVADGLAQETAPRPEWEQQMEAQAEETATETEDDSWWQQVEYLRRHPVPINIATAREMEALPMLNALQIAAFIRYRSLMGPLTDLYELQAVPGWDAETVRKVLPYCTLGTPENTTTVFSKRLTQGEYSWLIRSGQTLEKANGYQTGAVAGKDHYLGNRMQLFTRFRYNYQNLLQYGITADKDAGEPLFREPRKQGFDFYSFHLFARKIGKVQALALGDFTVNMGQGLIHWQSLAFRKSALVMQIKRQSEVLRPYSAGGEYNFHRGAGITLQHRHWQATTFASVRQLDANLKGDSVAGSEYVSSLQTYGLHRTPAENADRYNLQQLTVGANLRYTTDHGHVGVNAVHYQFSYPFRSSPAPYDLYALHGNRWSNHSVDYSYTYRNMHLYGELATDHQLNKALLQGMLISLERRVDMALVYRHIDKAYQSMYGNAFTESYYPSNEQGLYTAITIRPASGWQWFAYADLFRFPWLKYGVHAPTQGAEYLLQAQYTPNKKVELTGRYRYERKPVNNGMGEEMIQPVVPGVKQQWRWQAIFQAGKRITLKSRWETATWHAEGQRDTEHGFSAFTELYYKSTRSFAANLRLHYYETDSYNAGIYSYEQDVQYAFSIPLFNGKGIRYYVNLKYDVGKWLPYNRLSKIKAVMWMKFAQTIMAPGYNNGTGTEQINSRYKSALKLQCILTWH